jgi:hypothetical protein
MLCNHLRCAEFTEGKLRMLMNITPPRNDPRFDLLGKAVEFLMESI